MPDCVDGEIGVRIQSISGKPKVATDIPAIRFSRSFMSSSSTHLGKNDIHVIAQSNAEMGWHHIMLKL